MSKQFNLSINMNNAAFDEDNQGYELSNILSDIAKMMEDGFIKGIILDSNGNNVGIYAITID